MVQQCQLQWLGAAIFLPVTIGKRILHCDKQFIHKSIPHGKNVTALAFVLYFC